MSDLGGCFWINFSKYERLVLLTAVATSNFPILSCTASQGIWIVERQRIKDPDCKSHWLHWGCAREEVLMDDTCTVRIDENKVPSYDRYYSGAVCTLNDRHWGMSATWRDQVMASWLQITYTATPPHRRSSEVWLGTLSSPSTFVFRIFGIRLRLDLVIIYSNLCVQADYLSRFVIPQRVRLLVQFCHGQQSSL